MDKTSITTNLEASQDKAMRTLKFDWPSFKIGIAEYPNAPTGCTAFIFPNNEVNAVLDKRGGATGSFYTDDIVEGVSKIDAIVFSGGSLLGLEAVSGVMREVFMKNNSHAVWGGVPFVSGAVIYDWIHRSSRLYPDIALGKRAYHAAEYNIFYLGRRGAGINATVGKFQGLQYAEPGGQGGSFRVDKRTKIAVFTVVNSVGAIYDRQGQLVKGCYNSEKKQHIQPSQEIGPSTYSSKQTCPKNTTLSIVIINVDLDFYQLNRLVKQVHNSFNEVIRPFGTMLDGDCLYLVSTKEVQLENSKDPYAIPKLGSSITEVARDAIDSIWPEFN